MLLIDRKEQGMFSNGRKVAARTVVAATMAATLGMFAVATPSAMSADKVPRTASKIDLEKAKSHKLGPVLALALKCQEKAIGLKDYQAVFSKKELVGRQLFTQTMNVKIRHEPFSVYVGYHAPHEGREAIFVEDENDGKILAHDSGVKSIVGTIALDPNGRRAMENNRYPITNLGIATMTRLLIEQWESELSHDEVEVKYYPNARLGDMDCKVVETSHPVPRKHFRFHLTRLYIDRETNLPVRLEQFGWPTSKGEKPPIIEEYTYSKIRPNVGLTNVDFDAKNPAYGF